MLCDYTQCDQCWLIAKIVCRQTLQWRLLKIYLKQKRWSLKYEIRFQDSDSELIFFVATRNKKRKIPVNQKLPVNRGFFLSNHAENRYLSWESYLITTYLEFSGAYTFCAMIDWIEFGKSMENSAL